MMDSVLEAYGLRKESMSVVQLHQGLINGTWKLFDDSDAYILQRVNDKIFKNPEAIASNIALIAEYLNTENSEYDFVAPIKTLDGRSLHYEEGDGYYRAFPFVKNSHSKDTAATAEEAYEAARQFGRFTKVLKGLDSSKLKITIPSFHNLSLRYAQFLDAIANGNPARVTESADIINKLQQFSWIAEVYEEIKNNTEFKLRVTHHDTKIGNVLFDQNNKGLCVIDLDTVMPGFFISDVGDMMRTYLSPVSEEEKDFSKIEIREEFYEAIVKGYYQEMKEVLTPNEKQHFFYAGSFMIYMQAIRFLTDYLNDDRYYGAAYAGHNLMRAGNQLVLLQRLLERKEGLSEIVRTYS